MSGPRHVDHLVLLAPDLVRGCDDVERRLGVRPMIAGHHPQWGTWNAVLSLGRGCYLEVLAPDPGAPAPQGGRLFADQVRDETYLLTWATPTADVDESVARARAAGIDPGRVSAGRRRRTDGTHLEWRLSAPDALPFGGVLPFFLEWGDSPHPSFDAPSGCRLVGLRARHPRHQEATDAAERLGLDLEIAPGDVGLEVTIEAPTGAVVLT